MARGELFFRLPDGAWEDMYDVYGISFTDASLSKLMTPAPNKEVIENKSRLQHGKRIVRKSQYTYKDERDVDLEMHLSAPSISTFWSRYDAFCSKYLDNGFFDIKSGYRQDRIFRMTYLSCNQFSEFVQELAKFTLRLNEPNPDNRGEQDSDIIDTNNV